MFPPARFPHFFPQPSDLRRPSPAPDEEVVPRLRLPPVTPPALIYVGLFDFITQIRPYGRAPREELAQDVFCGAGHTSGDADG